MKQLLGLGMIFFLVLSSCAQDNKNLDNIIEQVKLSEEYIAYRQLADERRALIELYDESPEMKTELGETFTKDYPQKFKIMQTLSFEIDKKTDALVEVDSEMDRDEFMLQVENFIDGLEYLEELKTVQKRIHHLIYGTVVPKQIDRILARFPSITKEEILQIKLNDFRSPQN